MKKHLAKIHFYPSEDGGYVMRWKQRGGQRVLVKLSEATENKAKAEARLLLTEAMHLLRADMPDLDLD